MKGRFDPIVLFPPGNTPHIANVFCNASSSTREPPPQMKDVVQLILHLATSAHQEASMIYFLSGPTLQRPPTTHEDSFSFLSVCWSFFVLGFFFFIWFFFFFNRTHPCWYSNTTHSTHLLDTLYLFPPPPPCHRPASLVQHRGFLIHFLPPRHDRKSPPQSFEGPSLFP